MNFNNNRDLWFDAFALEKDGAWVFANNFNALFYIDLSTGKSNYIASVPNEKMSQQGLFYNMLKYRDELILIPAYATYLTIYNTVSRSFRSIRIDIKAPKFYGATIFNGKLCLVGNSSPEIILIDIESLMIIERYCIDEYYNYAKKIGRGMFFRKNECVVGKQFFIASCVSNEIVAYDFVNHEIQRYSIDGEYGGFRNIVFDGDYFWITSWDKEKVIKWSPTNGVVLTSEGMPGVFKSSDIIADERIYVFPLIGTHVSCYDKNGNYSELMEYKPYFSEEKNHPWGGQEFVKTVKYDNSLISFHGNTFSIIKYDLTNGDICSFRCIISEIDILKLLIENQAVNYEDVNFLKGYLKYLEMDRKNEGLC